METTPTPMEVAPPTTDRVFDTLARINAALKAHADGSPVNDKRNHTKSGE